MLTPGNWLVVGDDRDRGDVNSNGAREQGRPVLYVNGDPGNLYSRCDTWRMGQDSVTVLRDNQ